MSTYTRWRGRLKARQALLTAAKARLKAAEKGLAWARREDRHPRAWRVKLVEHERKTVKLREAQVAFAKRVVARHKPKSLRDRAYGQAVALIGVMEAGGNNRGPMVSKIITSSGGRVGDAWCGWFCHYCYRLAGSHAPMWKWAAVRLMADRDTGLVRTSSPKRGDLVRFTFDHVGMFVRDLGDGRIETIEGNTGTSGAVSDSRTGGDGVYRKVRPKHLVRDYLRATR